MKTNKFEDEKNLPFRTKPPYQMSEHFCQQYCSKAIYFAFNFKTKTQQNKIISYFRGKGPVFYGGL